MSSVESLRRQVDAIRARVGRPGDPKHWVFCMAAGADIPACVASQMGPHDTAVICEVNPNYFNGMFGEDEPGSCTVITTRGNFLVDMQDGRWTVVNQSVARRR